MRVEVRCPAKVNWFLAVGPPDATGYHPLRTVFQAVSLFDQLTVSDADRTQIVSDWPELPYDSTLHKTLRLASELVDIPPLRIEVKKNIPAQSGLGGGSSDAAGLLRALRGFTQPRLQAHDEHAIARAIGADVPFFLVGGRARGTGYGDLIEPMFDRASAWLVIVRPPAGVSTALAYQELDRAPRPWREFPNDEDEFYNDFERVAPCECIDASERMRAFGASATLLCGSGSAVYGVFKSQEETRSVAERLHADCRLPAWAVRTLTREESLWISSS